MSSLLKIGSTKVGAIASYVNGVRTSPQTYSQGWVRNPDWIPMPAFSPSEQVFYGIVAITNDNSNFLAFRVLGNYTVDWGDGVVENFASGVVAQHLYNYSSISSDTEYLLAEGVVARQVLVKITPQAGQNLTTIDLQRKYVGKTLPNDYSHNFLDISLNAPNLTILIIGDPNDIVKLSLCERIKIGATSVTSYQYKFTNLFKLQDISIEDTTNVTNMATMFQNCYSLQSVPLFNTANVTNMSQMFIGCNSLQSVPLFNTANVTNMSAMFSGCFSLQSVPLFNTANVTNMLQMFNGCSSLQSVPLFNTANVTNMQQMFGACSSLQSVPLFNTANVTNMLQMFFACRALQSVPLFNTANVTNMQQMFSGCNSLQSVPLFNTGKVTNMSTMFQNCNSLQSVPLFNTANVTNMSTMFSGCNSLQSVPLFNTANVINMSQMFSGCDSLQSVPPLNVSNVTDVTSMFLNCSPLASAPLSGTKISISYINCKLAREQIVDIFNNLATVSGQTITLTGNHGVTDLTSADRLIATSKGWTIVE